MELEQKLVELIDKAEAAGTKLAPEALDALVRAAHLEGWVALIIGAMFLLGLVPLGVVSVWVGIKFRDKFPNDTELVPVVIGCFATALSIIIGLAILTQSSNWLAAIDPLAYVARQILMP